MELIEYITGERIYLKKPDITFEFAEKMFEAVASSRDSIIPWLDWALPEITGRAEDNFAFAIEADKAWKRGERFEYAIYNNIDGDFLGIIGIFKSGNEKNKACELGYWLKKQAQGNGYMQEAIKLIENELFSKGIVRIAIKVDVENKKSNEVAKRAGYTFEGTLAKSRYSMCFQQLRDINLYAKIQK